MKTAKKRMVFKVELDGQTAKKFDSMSEETGVTRIALASRLVSWFSRQDQEIQANILGMFGSEGSKNAGKLILSKIADGAPLR